MHRTDKMNAAEEATVSWSETCSRTEVDYLKIWEEAKSRWLRPNEIYDILCNHKKFKICSEPPNFPPSGTLILFNRKILRNFRRDGHPWKKKKDNKTVKEAHEHLKVESEERIHVYYAHGEDNPNFQRRVYWLLEKALENIVLVHYLQVKEGNRANTQQLYLGDPPQGAFVNVEEPSQILSSSSPSTAFVHNFSPGDSEDLSSTLALQIGEPNSDDDFDKFSLEELKSSVEVGSGLENPTTIAGGGQMQWMASLPTSSTQPGNLHLGGNHDMLIAPSVQYDDLKVDTMHFNSMPMQNAGGGILDFNMQHANMLGIPGGVSNLAVGKGHCERKDNNIDCEECKIHEINTLSWEDLLAASSTPIEVGFQAHADMQQDINTPTVVSSNVEGIYGSLAVEPEIFTGESMSQHMSSISISSGMPLDHVMSNWETENRDHANLNDQQSEQHQLWRSNGDANFTGTSVAIDSNIQGGFAQPSMGSQTHSFPVDDVGIFKKLHSLDRWMNAEVPAESQSTLIFPTETGNCWAASLQAQSQNMTGAGSISGKENRLKEELTPCFPHHILFNITEISPSWGFSKEETKIIVIGQFLDDPLIFPKLCWSCMFGEVEVPAEIVQIGVLRCKSPQSAPGCVPFHVACEKQVCSEVKEFEYRDILNGSSGVVSSSLESRDLQLSDDENLQIQFARLLLSSNEDSVTLREKIVKDVGPLDEKLRRSTAVHEKDWTSIENLVATHRNNTAEVKEQLLQIFFKKKLRDWLLCKVQGGGKGPSVLDRHGHGVLHLASGLGYEWAIVSALASGININFRDKNGYTALHWAAAHGRENMIAALLAAGANPGLISDPTPKCPTGYRAADLAARLGLDGIAGYLAESDLENHLSSLTLNENESNKQFAAAEGHRIRDYLKRSTSLHRSVVTVEDKISLEKSISAVSHATEAARRIQLAFQDHALKERLRSIEEVDDYGLSQEEARAFLAAHRIQNAYRKHREHKMQESAALRIQNRFRSWKGRKDFLLLRQRVIKLQAYFRMHRARKQYHRILWSVGILEKAILRWRQKKKGLRGFQAESDTFSQENSDDFLKIGRRQAEESLEKSVIRVQAMVRSKQARQQYQKMLETVKKAKADFEQLTSTCLRMGPDSASV